MISRYIRTASTTVIILLAVSICVVETLANVDLLYFRALSSSNSIVLEWETASEIDNLGFNIYRSIAGECGDGLAINLSLIPSQVGGQPIGAFYEFEDLGVADGNTYTYWLEDVDINGGSECHGPVAAAVSGGNTIPTPLPPVGTSVAPTHATTPNTAETVQVPATTMPGTTATGGTGDQEASPNPTTAITATTASPTLVNGATPDSTGVTQSQHTATSLPTPSDSPGNSPYPGPVNDNGSAGEATLSGPDPTIGQVNPAQTSVEEDAEEDASTQTNTQPAGILGAQAEFEAALPIGQIIEPDVGNPGEDSLSAEGAPTLQFSRVVLFFLVLSGTIAFAGGFATWFLVNRPRQR